MSEHERDRDDSQWRPPGPNDDAEWRRPDDSREPRGSDEAPVEELPPPERHPAPEARTGWEPGSAADDSAPVGGEDLAHAVECAIVGLGTCGSCTTFTIKDSVVVEDQQKPVVAIVTEEFEVHAHNVATHLGHGDPKVLVLPYPLEARPEAELRAIADEFYPQVLALLGETSQAQTGGPDRAPSQSGDGGPEVGAA